MRRPRDFALLNCMTPSSEPYDRGGPPRLSVALPVYNGERFLAEAIESLLCQTFTDFELIITDNASADATEEISRSFAARDSRIRYERAPRNLGAAWNFNRGFHLARGQYFKWAAHDDLHHPRFLERCVAVLDADPDVVLCFTRTEFIDDHGRHLREYPFPVDVNRASRRELFLVYAAGGHIMHEVFGVIRRSALEGGPLIGSYVGSDHVLVGTLALRGRFYQVPEVLFQHREHEGRSTRTRGGARGYTRWFDTRRPARWVMPYWRRLFENCRNVLQAPLSATEKAAHVWDLCRSANWNRRELLGEVLRLGRN